MAEKVVKTRIQQKHDIEANWNKATNFIPLKGEMIVYDVDSNYSYERYKLGDGVQTVTALPFADAHKANATHNHDSAYDVKGAADAVQSNLNSHISDKSNPHSVTLSQLGITVTADELNYVDGVTSNIQAQLNDKAAKTSLDSHIQDKSNPHNVTYIQTGADQAGAADAVQSNLSAHAANDTHITSAERANLTAAKTHADSPHARTDATKAAGSSTNGNILINDTETKIYSHPNSGIAAGTYKSVTVDVQGHITAGTNPTTLAGYGITDAEPKGSANAALTSAKAYTDSVASGKSNTDHDHGDVYALKGEIGTKVSDDGAGNVVLTNISVGGDNTDSTGAILYETDPTVPAWAKADTKPSYTASEIGAYTKVEVDNKLSGKADLSHGTHVSYGTSATAVGSAAGAGSAATVSRSDHTHSLSKAAVTAALGYTPPTTDTQYTHPSSHPASMITGLATVATSGKYSDLSGTPTIPTKTSQLTNDSGYKTTDTNTTYTVATGDSNGQIKVTPSSGSAYNVSVKGLGSAAYTASTAYAASSHTHDDRYYTESEVNTKLSGKANSSHGNHVPSTQTANNSVFLRNDNTWATVTPANIGAAASSHNQAASTITAGTFAGQVVANASNQAPGTSLVRNSKIVSSDTNPSNNGEICWTYK